ncbi:MAG TPA: twin-arginine translocase subunit TatC [Solirubrobacteraceae bacterium]|nr:twin-arginine translocase subunit TatC [Solirubrobacteraceae bacterium]
MTRRLRPIGYEDRLSVVDHLDELRRRLFVCLGVLAVAFGICFWQSGRIEHLLNRPLDHLSRVARDHISGTASNEVGERGHLLRAAGGLSRLAHNGTLPAGDGSILRAVAGQLHAAATALPAHTPGEVPITTNLAEPFTVSITVAFYFAVVIASPILLYELFAFLVPALTERQRRMIRPTLITAPLLFFTGIVFTYLIVLPAAIKFLQGYNSANFNSLIGAQPLYSFEVLTMGAIGFAFEMPLILLGLRTIGIINGGTLTTHWRYAILAIVILAAAMPGADPVTTGLETAPLVILYLASIVLLRLADRREVRQAASASASSTRPA